MNSKTILERAKALYDEIPTNVKVIGGCVLIIAVVTILLYITAPSHKDVPKAVIQEQIANVEEQKSAISETEANTIHTQKAEAQKETQAAKKTLNERKAQYEEVRNTPVAVDNSNLDSRERKLQSDLKSLYPANDH